VQYNLETSTVTDQPKDKYLVWTYMWTSTLTHGMEVESSDRYHHKSPSRLLKMMVEDFSCILCGFSAVLQPLVLRYLGTTCLECDTASIKTNLDTPLFGNQCLFLSVLYAYQTCKIMQLP